MKWTVLKFVSWVPVAAAFFLAGQAGAMGPERHENLVLSAPGVAVYFPAPLHRVAGEILDSYPWIRAEAENVFGWDMNDPVTIVLMGRSSAFEMSAGSSSIVAYAVPGRNLMVIDYRKLQNHPFTLRSAVMHELLHLILHRHIRPGLLPRWFEEGVCQWASDGLGEIISGGGSLLDRAVSGGDLIPFRSLERAFPADPAGMRLAYEQSKSFVTYLVGRHGRESLVEILESMKSGFDFHQAVEAALGISAGRLEGDWRASLSRPVAWARVVSRNLYGLVFGLGAVLALVGFIRVTIKKRRALREYDDDEELQADVSGLG